MTPHQRPTAAEAPPPAAARSRRWPLWAALAAVAALLVLLGQGMTRDPRELPSALIGQPWPAFSLPSLAQPGRALGLADLQGRPRVVNVWASWCATCREEHPALLALAAELKARGRADQLLGLNYKDTPAAAADWLRDGGNPYADSIVDAAGRLGIDLGVYGVPETFVTDARGRIVYKHVGALTDAVVRERILPLLREGA